MSRETMIGRRVLLINGHPHAGFAGMIDRFEVVETLNKEAAVVKLDSGQSCFLFKQEHFTFIDNTPAKRRVRRR